ncbi:MAG: response regulator [Acidimicrobiales bacterium]
MSSHGHRAGPGATGPGTTTVVIVDDHPVATEGLRAHLAGAGCVVEAAVAAVEHAPAAATAPGSVTVCDLRLPGRSGADAIAYLAGRGATVLATSGVATGEEVLDAVAAGARGFLPKTAPMASFADAVAALAGGSHHLSPALAHYLRLDVGRRPLTEGEELGPDALGLLGDVERGEPPGDAAARHGIGPERLAACLEAVWAAEVLRRRRYQPTAREQEVLRLVGDGRTHRELAAALHLSVHTVPDLLAGIKLKYLLTHPDTDPAAPPLTLARRWSRELGLS